MGSTVLMRQAYCEIALVIRDDYQDKGIGTELLSYLTYLAKRNGLLDLQRKCCRTINLHCVCWKRWALKLKNSLTPEYIYLLWLSVKNRQEENRIPPLFIFRAYCSFAFIKIMKK